KRARSLLVPYVAWNILCLLVTLLAQSLRATSKYVSGRSAPIASLSIFGYFNAVLGITTHPIAYQFWFVRDLFLLILLSQLIYFLLTRLPLLFFAAVVPWWAALDVFSLPVLSREAILFFSIGAFLAIHRINPLDADRVAFLSWLYLPLSIADALTKQQPFNNPLHKVAELFGIFCVFCAAKYVLRWPACRDWLFTLS